MLVFWGVNQEKDSCNKTVSELSSDSRSELEYDQSAEILSKIKAATKIGGKPKQFESCFFFPGCSDSSDLEVFGWVVLGFLFEGICSLGPGWVGSLKSWKFKSMKESKS